MLRLSDKLLLKASLQIEGIIKKVALEIEKLIFSPVTSTVQDPLTRTTNLKMLPKARTEATENDSNKILVVVLAEEYTEASDLQIEVTMEDIVEDILLISIQEVREVAN
jgi:hypothetical protein